MGHIIEAKPYGLNDTQKMIQRWGGGVVTLRIDLGYISFQPAKISGWHKDKQSLIQYIALKEANDDVGDTATSNSKVSIFDRLQPYASQQCASVCSRLKGSK